MIKLDFVCIFGIRCSFICFVSLSSGSLSAMSSSPRFLARVFLLSVSCLSEFLYALILLLGFFVSLNYYNIFIILYWFLLFSFPPSFKFIIIINVCFRFFVFLASSCRGCLTILHDERTTTTKRRIGANNSLSLLTDPNPTKERIVSRGAVFSVCAFGFGCECMCYVRSSSILDASGGINLLVVCLCVCFLSQARARSLTFGSLTLSLSRSVSLSPLFLSLAL